MIRTAMATTSITLLSVALTGCQAGGAAKVAPAYDCHFATSPVKIDGKLDEAAWAKATKITQFFVLQPEGAKALSPTTARLLWDDRNLYVAFECTDDDVWSYSDKPDDELWNGDVGELFVKPSATGRVYYEFVTAPNGAQYDGKYTSRGAGGFNRFKDWSSGAKIATSIDGTDGDGSDDDRGYVIEMAFPLKAFAGATPPADGVVWTFGAFRYDYTKSYEDPLLLMSMPESLHHGFHYYEGYNRLTFRKIKK